jgi:1-acyl-sn-glycerol-3-phosphate acyltransferase
VKYWKTGFYRIAAGAGVPILPAYLDYKNKLGGFGSFFIPPATLITDMEIIRAFYSDKTGKNAKLFQSEHVRLQILKRRKLFHRLLSTLRAFK